ncbi:ARM repeat superfamily protein [Artemisia annua]|uniref:ARM repeat superfamily protein n=1 Tax=Artemisia annua TaxID=35608 RepID=A0A2U1QLK5_ARTAN|nr:ARM repeat superfamily protein [Artemisia annua]
MALRSLDNTLPLSPERPKKTIKVTNLIAKKAKQVAGPDVNNENVAPVDTAAPVVDAVDYVLSENLEAFSDPDVKIQMLQLLLKASQDKKFVCEEAERTLKTMVVSTASIPLLHKVKVYVKHGNMRVRAKAAVSVAQCVSKMDVGEMKEYGLVLLVQMSAELLKDRLPEAREAARGMILLIHKVVVEEEEEAEKQQEMWQSFCQSNLSAIDALAMAKLVASQ